MHALGAWLYDGVLSRTEAGGLRDWRRRLLQQAHGVVVEIGAGTGLNLPHYPAGVERLLLTEPAAPMRARLAERVAEVAPAFPVEVLAAGAEALPLDDGSVDVVVGTLVLCTVPSPEAVLGEVRRVLRPGGRLLFLEHGAAPAGSGWRRVQGVVEPVWRPLAGGCRLTREALPLLRAAGFTVEDAVAEALPRAPGFLSPSVRGCARRDA
jgi:ubiquinone/menaquinone biosynthesis C-methylase UbiE